MSQNPNPNPYGQNPPDPNAPPGTFYGSPPPPPGQGSSPNYGPYIPNPPSPGQNPPGYDPYNPYAPNPPTPAPAVNPNYNPYDPYAPTLAGQEANPNYSPYAPPVPPAPPPTQPRRGLSGRVIVLIALVIVLVVGGLAIGLVSYNNVQTSNANATATAQANGTQTAHLTATAQASATAYAIQTTYPFSNNLKLQDSLTGNTTGANWQVNDTCGFSGSAYHVQSSQTNTYSSCVATNTDFSDVTFEVEMSISKGDGGGLLFRGNVSKQQFYLFEIDSNGDYEIYVYVDTTSQNARTLETGTLSVTLNPTNTIAIVARGSTLKLYVNQAEITSVPDSTYTHGQIGFAAIDRTKATDVVFTNMKVWQLSPGP